MSRLFTIASAVVAAFLISGCGKETEAEKQEKEREKLRETKRENAIKYYKTIGEKFPDDPRAAEAVQRAKALEASRPKK